MQRNHDRKRKPSVSHRDAASSGPRRSIKKKAKRTPASFGGPMHVRDKDLPEKNMLLQEIAWELFFHHQGLLHARIDICYQRHTAWPWDHAAHQDPLLSRFDMYSRQPVSIPDPSASIATKNVSNLVDDDTDTENEEERGILVTWVDINYCPGDDSAQEDEPNEDLQYARQPTPKVGYEWRVMPTHYVDAEGRICASRVELVPVALLG